MLSTIYSPPPLASLCSQFTASLRSPMLSNLQYMKLRWYPPYGYPMFVCVPSRSQAFASLCFALPPSLDLSGSIESFIPSSTSLRFSLRCQRFFFRTQNMKLRWYPPPYISKSFYVYPRDLRPSLRFASLFPPEPGSLRLNRIIHPLLDFASLQSALPMVRSRTQNMKTALVPPALDKANIAIKFRNGLVPPYTILLIANGYHDVSQWACP